MPGVVIAYPSPGEVAARFTDSLTELIRVDAHGPRHLVGTISLRSGPRVAEARSQIVDAFIDHHVHGDAKAEWLLMLDSDMVFEPDLIDRLLETAHPEMCPVLGGLAFAGVHGARCFPTIYKMYNEADGHVAIDFVDDYPKDALVKVGATGAACLLVHRSVFGAMRRPGPAPGESFDPKVHGFGTLANGQPNPFPWFAEGLTTEKGIPLGEDIAFARRCMYLGIPMHVDTSIKVGHCKEWVITEACHDDYLRERDRPSNVLTAAMRVLRQSGQFGPDDLDRIADYLRPRWSLLGPDARPSVEPFLLPEAVKV